LKSSVGMRGVENLELKKNKMESESERISRDGYFKSDNDKKINKVVLHSLKDILENKTYTKKKSPFYII